MTENRVYHVLSVADDVGTMYMWERIEGVE